MIAMTEEAKEELRGSPGSPDRVRDQRIEQVVPLVTPEMMLRERPMTPKQADIVLEGRAEIGRILDREDDRLLVVVGCAGRHGGWATTCASRCACTSRSLAPPPAGRG